MPAGRSETTIRVRVVGNPSQAVQTLRTASNSALGYGRTLDRTGAAADRLTRRTNRASAAVRAQSRTMDVFAKRLRRLPGLLVAFAGIGGIAGVTREALRFDVAMREVSTLLDVIPGQMDRLTGAVQRQSIAFGQQQTVVARGIYQIISAGITDTAAAIDVLEASNRLAIAGVTDVATAADLLTTIINSYGLAASEATRISDVLFETVRAGKTTIPELATSLGRVAALGASANISLEELTAAMAILTQGGLDSRVAVTGLRGAINSILKPSVQAMRLASELGIELGAARLAAVGLAGVLDDIQRATGGNVGQITTIVGSLEALQGVLPLIGPRNDDFIEQIERHEQAVNSTADAYEKVASSVDFSLKSLSAAVTARFSNVGNNFLREIQPIIDGWTRILELPDAPEALLNFAEGVANAERRSLTRRQAPTQEGSLRFYRERAAYLRVAQPELLQAAPTEAQGRAAIAALEARLALQQRALQERTEGVTGSFTAFISAINPATNAIRQGIDITRRSIDALRILEQQNLLVSDSNKEAADSTAELTAAQRVAAEIAQRRGAEGVSAAERRLRQLQNDVSVIQADQDLGRSVGIDESNQVLDDLAAEIAAVKDEINGVTDAQGFANRIIAAAKTPYENASEALEILQKAAAVAEGSTTELNAAIALQLVEVNKLAAGTDRFDGIQERFQRTIESGLTAIEQTTIQMEFWDDALLSNKITTEQHELVIAQLIKRLDRLRSEGTESVNTFTDTFTNAFRDAFVRAEGDLDDFLDRLQQTLKETVLRVTVDAIIGDIESGIQGILSGSGGLNASAVASNLLLAVGAQTATSGGGGLQSVAQSVALADVFNQVREALGNGVGINDAIRGIDFRGALLTAGASFVGANVGNTLGESIFDKQAESQIAGQIGGVVGAILGGPVGAGIGAAIGSFLDVAFGGDGSERSNAGAFVGEAAGKSRYRGDPIFGESGLRFTPFARRQDDEAADSFTQGLLTLDQALTNTLRQFGIFIDLTGRDLAGRNEDDGSRRAPDGTFFGLSGLVQDAQGEARKFVLAFLDELGDDLPSRVRGIVQRLSTQTAEELVEALAPALQIDKLLDLDVIHETGAALAELAASQRPLLDQYLDATVLVRELASAGINTVDALSALSDAFTEQAELALRLAIQYQTIGEQTAQQFENLIDTIQRSVLSPEELYNLYSGEVEANIADLSNTIDAGEIERLSRLIIENARNAFNLLDESQRTPEVLAEFERVLRDADSIAQTQLGLGLARVGGEDAALRRDVEIALAAAQTQSNAADRFDAATIRFDQSIRELLDDLARGSPGTYGYGGAGAPTGSFEINA